MLHNSYTNKPPFTKFSVVVPGPPEDIHATADSTAFSLTLQARLSTIGTAPILSAHFVVSGPDGTPSSYNITQHFVPGELVTVKVEGLQPTTAYSVLVYATNAAGRGGSSMPVTFTTCKRLVIYPFHSLLNLLISCYCHSTASVDNTGDCHSGVTSDGDSPPAAPDIVLLQKAQ